MPKEKTGAATSWDKKITENGADTSAPFLLIPRSPIKYRGTQRTPGSAASRGRLACLVLFCNIAVDEGHDLRSRAVLVRLEYAITVAGGDA